MKIRSAREYIASYQHVSFSVRALWVAGQHLNNLVCCSALWPNARFAYGQFLWGSL
jgi:hypothetical protein